MRLLIAPDKFKGSLTALQAAEAISRGFSSAYPEAMIVVIPIADGGEGTAEAICAARGGRWIILPAEDPLGREIVARYAWLDQDIAAIDMSEASGLWRAPAERRNPLKSSTFGTGQLIADALKRGGKEILVGLGGSATNDGGIGMAAALGFEFFDSNGEKLEPVPANLPALAHVKAPEPPVTGKIIALCDVTNPLCGPRGASQTFGPQKGADQRTVAILDESLAHLADVVKKDLGCDFRDKPGAGAAGGLGFGLLTFCGAEICSGFNTLSSLLRLENEVASSDLVITGEGRLDRQTLDGKGPCGVAALAHRHGKPVIAFAGAISKDLDTRPVFDGAFAITPPSLPLEEALRDAAVLLERSVAAFAAQRRGKQASAQ